MSDHRQKLLEDWTMGDWQDEAKAQREARETAEHQLHEARTQLERCQGEAKRVREHAFEADGALQPVIGMIRLAQSRGEEIDEDHLRRLVRANDHLMRLKDGEDYEAKYAALSTQPTEPNTPLPSSSESDT